MHDRLRKRLPQHLKEKVPTSLARSVYVTESALDPSVGCGRLGMAGKIASTKATESLPGLFGSIVDLPGGWKRKTGSETVVISPTGEKFKSIPKLEDFLAKQGIHSDARVLFGAAGASHLQTDAKVHHHKSKKKKKKKKKHKHKSYSRDGSPTPESSGSFVTTTLPGGWVRRTKFRTCSITNRARFDVYVTSPDGRIFRSKKQLSAYFQQIGKVDDILKYFPLFHDRADRVTTSSDRTETESSTEPGSSSEMWSDEVSHNVLPTTLAALNLPSAHALGLGVKLNNNDKLNIFASEDTSHEDFVGFVRDSNVQNRYLNSNDYCKDDSKKNCTKDSKVLNSSKICDTNSKKVSESMSKVKKSSINIEIASLVLLPREDNRTFDKACDKDVPNSKEKHDDFTIIDFPGGWRRRAGIETTVVSPDGNVFNSVKKLREYLVKKCIDENPDHLFGTVNSIRVSSPPNLPRIDCNVENLALPKIPKISENKCPGGFENAPPLKSTEQVDASQLVRAPSPDSELVISPKAKVKPSASPATAVFKAFQTQHFGDGWARKIKWNPDGTGKVSFVVTPAGSKIQSMMELLGYLKKEGIPTTDASFYFPSLLNRADVPEKVQTIKATSKATKAKSAAAAHDQKKTLQSNSITEPEIDVCEELTDLQTALDSGGPRIKRVCRSLEQVRPAKSCI